MINGSNFSAGLYTLEFEFQEQAVKVSEGFTVYAESGRLSRTESFCVSQPDIRITDLTGKPFTATIREKTFFSSSPDGKQLTKKYCLEGDKVHVMDVDLRGWVKVHYSKSNTTGWIYADSIDRGL